MSVDLGVWYARTPLTPEEAARKYVEWRAGAHPEAEPAPEVSAFYDALTRAYPDLPDADYETSPWATPLTVGDDFVVMSIVFPRAGEICRAVLELAERHGFVCFDPQAEQEEPDPAPPSPETVPAEPPEDAPAGPPGEPQVEGGEQLSLDEAGDPTAADPHGGQGPRLSPGEPGAAPPEDAPDEHRKT
ncbi:hypothetical protein [Sphaerisporangium sp. TRM90804]|uniref:hypothetical protein n=1 Tax=Sphaerisporangium sp. TRM90804 TaxID=3031113 RepID=UPI00244AB5FB|nr:hypothetical protein [Sphaerisporangium sp. TRM90804]MDH2424999.1 hypothetical protein [Sphaerisporangium sp. TRM90804]